MYNHVKQRFIDKGLTLPYGTFHSPYSVRNEIFKRIKTLGEKYNFCVEACGEPDIESISCVSIKDLEILGLSDKIVLKGEKGQRKTCHCPSNKKELIKEKPHRCENKCLYCYWKN